MAATNNTIELLAALDKAQSIKNINNDINKIKKQIKPLELQLKLDSKSLQGLDSMEKALEKTEDSTDSSLNSMLDLWGAFGAAIEKILPSNSMVSGFNNLTNLISSLNDTTKGFLSSLGTVGLGAGLFAGLKNIGKSRASARISNA